MSLKKSNKSLDNISPEKINNIIKGSNTLLKLFCCLTIVVIICILIGHYAFKNGILSCEHYVFNTYLYIILAILLTFMVVLINDQTGIFNFFILWMSQGSFVRIILTFIIIIVILFGLQYQLHKVDPQNIVASNMIWVTLILLLGFFLIPTIWFGRLNDVVGIAGILTIIITTIVGLLGYYYGDKIVTFDWDKYLSYALLGLIAIILIGLFTITDPKTMYIFIMTISILSLIIFTLLLLSNHKKLKQNADKCIDGQAVPNYPLESFGIFIKMLNIFVDLIRILGMLKGRSRGIRR
jgi:FtsH-binding integral membrane protein